MGKLIIDNRSSLGDAKVLLFIKKIIDSGRISGNGKQYCYLSTFSHDGKTCAVASDVNKCSDKFTVTDYPA